MDPALQLRLQDANLKNLLKTGGFRFADEQTPWFPYTSGQVGPYYVQTTAIEKDGEAYATAIQSLVELVRYQAAPFDAVSGGETRDWDFSNPLAVALRKPHVKLFKNREPLGAPISGTNILHVSDLNNEGSSVRDLWRPAIERNGGRLVGLLSFVDRMEDGYVMLRNSGLPVMAVVPLDERAWNAALEGGYLSETVHRDLVERLKDRRGWAVRALLENPFHFKALFDDPAARHKAEKIIATYPEIEKQLRRVVDKRPAS